MTPLERLRRRPTVAMLEETFREFGEDKVTRLGAALAFYAILALAPLLIIAIAIAGFFLGDAAAQGQVVDALTGIVGPQTAQFLEGAIQRASVQGGALPAGLSVAALLLAASGFFAHLQDAMDRVWDVEAVKDRGWRDFLRDRLAAFVMVLLVGVLLLVAIVAGTLTSYLTSRASHVLPGSALLWQALNLAASLLILVVVFALLFKYLPEVEVGWRPVWLGSALTAGLFLVGRYAIAAYLAHSTTASVYGAAGSLVVVLLWVFYSALIFFLGAEFTSVYARSRGHLGAPKEGARWRRRSTRRRIV